MLDGQQWHNLDDFLTEAVEAFEAAGLYYGHGTDNAWDEAVALALYVLGLPPDVDESVREQVLTEDEQYQLVALANRRIDERVPVPYLTGVAWFAGEQYKVTEDVLIPRSPIAEFLYNRMQPWLSVDADPKAILDMCTGSGCLAILAAKMFPLARVDAVDISSKALNVAHENIELHNCSDRVATIESDGFNSVPEQQYDIIISNPPYVTALEMEEMPVEFTHEPALALQSGQDGLHLTHHLLEHAGRYLAPEGLLVLEVGNQWEALQAAYPHVPFTWLEFAEGGEGVLLLDAEALAQINA